MLESSIDLKFATHDSFSSIATVELSVKVIVQEVGPLSRSDDPVKYELKLALYLCSARFTDNPGTTQDPGDWTWVGLSRPGSAM